ncbi:MAG: tRNA pseudouridine(13) synthase TruD [Methylophilaceae bacterium]
MTYTSLPQWPKTYPETHARGTLKLHNADFRVTELPLALPSGEGEHIWLQVKKDGANTAYVAQRLADYAGVKENDVGYAGLKDRYAITEQWFSIYFPKGETPDLMQLTHDEFTVLAQTRHVKKLRRGDLLGNQFDILLRDVKGEQALIEANLKQIQAHGVPNYFGPQRFGHDGGNVEQGRLMVSREIRVRNPKMKGIYLSAVRSFVFNEILAERINDGLWGKTLEGDVLDDADLNNPGAATGALWGRGRVATTDAAADLENTIAKQHAPLCEGMEHAGLTQDRRALAAIPEGMTWQWLDESQLQLTFSLSAGYYATSVLREILDVQEPERYKAEVK